MSFVLSQWMLFGDRYCNVRMQTILSINLFLIWHFSFQIAVSIFSLCLYVIGLVFSYLYYVIIYIWMYMHCITIDHWFCFRKHRGRMEPCTNRDTFSEYSIIIINNIIFIIIIIYKLGFKKRFGLQFHTLSKQIVNYKLIICDSELTFLNLKNQEFIIISRLNRKL